MEKEGRVNEYMRLYWMASDLGETEAITRLVDIYKKGEIVEKDIEESERLRRMLVPQFQKRDDGLEWRISQEDKTLFIRGTGRMTDYNSNKVPWEEHKSTILTVIIEEVESIGRCDLSGCKELKEVSILFSITTINSNLFTDYPKLVRIKVSENNPNYSTMNGVLFDKGKTFIIYCQQTMSGFIE